MELHLSPELESKLNISAARHGLCTDQFAADVLTRYLVDETRFFDVTDDWSEAELRAARGHIEEGLRQAEQGQTIDAPRARREMQAFKDEWRRQRESRQPVCR